MKTVSKKEFSEAANNYINSLNLTGIDGENSKLILETFTKALELQLFNDNGALTDTQNASIIKIIVFIEQKIEGIELMVIDGNFEYINTQVHQLYPKWNYWKKI